MVAGVRYQFKTPARSESDAVEHLRRFRANPAGYDPHGDAPRAPLHLDAKLVEEFLAFSEREGNSAGWRRKQKNILAWWADRLDGMDLRKVALGEHVMPALKRKDATSRHHRIAILKGLYSWLRAEVHRISVSEDPVFGTLKVPQASVAQLTRSKVVPRDHVLLVIERLRADEAERQRVREARKVVPLHEGRGIGPWADALTLQAATGWHTSEVQRFAAEGSIEPLPKHAQQEGVAGVVVCPMRKSGEPQRTRVGDEALEAAKRLRAHGALSREWYDRAVTAACGEVARPDGGKGIPRFTPGMLRHSVATWAIDVGADPAMVSAFLGHRSPRTTRKFYATHASPAKVPTLV
jgi:integrase